MQKSFLLFTTSKCPSKKYPGLSIQIYRSMGQCQGCLASLARATACGALAVSLEGTQAFEKADVERLSSLVSITNIIE